MTRLIPQTRFRSSACQFVAPNRGRISTPDSLVETVKAAVQQIAESSLRPVSAAYCGTLAFQPRVMLGLLTYYYARQIYGSLEIQNLMVRDTAFREMCQNKCPSAGEIQHFRQQNRSIIQTCLTAALLFLAGQKIDAGFITWTNETFIADEAKRRIIMAACVDSMDLEDGSWAFSAA
jgi:hypothetical protein